MGKNYVILSSFHSVLHPFSVLLYRTIETTDFILPIKTTENVVLSYLLITRDPRTVRLVRFLIFSVLVRVGLGFLKFARSWSEPALNGFDPWIPANNHSMALEI